MLQAPASKERPLGIRSPDRRRRRPAFALPAGAHPGEEAGPRLDLVAGDRRVHERERHADPARPVRVRQVRQARGGLQHRLPGRPRSARSCGRPASTTSCSSAPGRSAGDRVVAASFADHGFNIAGVFDSDPAKVGTEIGDRSRAGHVATCRPSIRDRNVIVGVLAVPEEAAQEAADRLVARGREDHLQLLRRAHRHAGRRHGAPVEPGRRDPARALLPPDVVDPARREVAGVRLDSVARLPARGHRLEHLHAARRAGVGTAGARRGRRLPGAAAGAVRARPRTCGSCGPTSGRCSRPSSSTATRASRPATWPT